MKIGKLPLLKDYTFSFKANFKIASFWRLGPKCCVPFALT